MDNSFNPVVAKNDLLENEFFRHEKIERDVSSGFGSRDSRDLTETLSTLSSRNDDTSMTSSTGHRARAGSRYSSMTSSGESLESEPKTYESVGASSHNYFDTFSEGPIYYMKPEFTKRIPAPKFFPELSYDDFFVQQPLYSGKSQRSKLDQTNNENSNWVLLPAAWGTSVQALVDPVEAKNESSEAKNSRFGFWVMLKPGMKAPSVKMQKISE